LCAGSVEPGEQHRIKHIFSLLAKEGVGGFRLLATLDDTPSFWWADTIKSFVAKGLKVSTRTGCFSLLAKEG
jgi:hypothetical protein